MLQIAIPFVTNFILLVILFAIIGFFSGIFMSMMAPVFYDLCGNSPTLVNQAIGYFSAAIAIPSVGKNNGYFKIQFNAGVLTSLQKCEKAKLQRYEKRCEDF